MWPPLQTLHLKWQQLSIREQRLLMLAGGLLIALIFYLALWRPVHQAHDRALQRFDAARADWQWLNETLAHSPPSATAPVRVLTPPALQEMLRQHRLQSALKQLRPDRKGLIEIQLQQAPAQAIINWLHALRQQYHVVPERIHIKPVKPGRVDVTVQLRAGGGAS